MESFVIVATFNLPQDLAIIRSRLESEGIECFVQDELTAQVNNFYSAAIGGIKLQVKEQDVEAARLILIEAGIISPSQDLKPSIFERIVTYTSRWPIVGQWPMERRLAVIFISALLFLSLFITFLPDLLAAADPDQRNMNQLADKNWCVDRFFLEREEVQPNTTGFRVTSGDCIEYLNFNSDGSVSLPGFDTPNIRAEWVLQDSTITLSHANNFYDLYEGDFTFELKGNSLKIRSDNALIYAYSEQ